MNNRLGKILSNMTFRGQILMVWFLVGIIPIVLILIVFLRRVTGMVEYQNRYALKQNFEQTCLTIEDKVGNMEEIASFLLANGTIQKAFQGDGDSSTAYEYLEQYEAVEAARRIFVDSNSVDEIVFYMNPEHPMAGKSSGNKYRDISLLQEESWCYSILEENVSARWGIITSDTLAFMEDYFSYVHVVQNAIDFNLTNGLVCLGLRIEKLEELMIPVMEEQYFYLITAEGLVISSNQDIAVIDASSEEGEVWQEGVKYYYLAQEVDSTGMMLVSIIPSAALSRQTRDNMAGLILILVVLLGGICIVYVLLSNMITKRIIRLAEACGNAEKGIFTKVEEDTSADEIGILYRAYNQMTDRIEYLLKEQFRIGEEVKDAQLKALQAQINPHFLYNTLEMISWMAAREDKKNVQNIIRNLSRYYRSVLNKGKDEIGLWDEIHMGMAYMEIQSYRFKGKLNFNCEVMEDLPDIEVPKLILQPLLENAIFHGVTRKKEGRGSIWLKVYRQDGGIVLEVSDDGVGFLYSETGESESGEKAPGSKYGLGNIRRRIELFWEGGAVLEVASSPGIGTSIYIRIPDEV